MDTADHRPVTSSLAYRAIVVGIYLLVGTIATISLRLSLDEIDAAVTDIARERGSVLFRLIELTRDWNARHGGIYVPVTETTQPNPYLKHPRRDITDAEGRRLTMVNPAFMTRQIAEIAEKAEGVRFHITSLKPIRPANTADAWETESLGLFERPGLKERLDFFADGGGGLAGPVHRYMAPLVVKPPCMKCHEAQGYKVGDIRGGISVTMPSGTLVAIGEQRRQNEIRLHLVAAVVVAGLGHLVAWRSRRHFLALQAINRRQDAIIAERTRDLSEANAALERDVAERKATEAELAAYRDRLEELVARRTAALQEAETRYRTVANFTNDWETWLDAEGRWVYCSPSSERITGHAAEAFVAEPDLFLDIVHPDDRPGMLEHLLETHEASAPHTVFNFRIVRPDGQVVWLEHACQPVFDEAGRHLGRRASNRDITARMEAEAALSRAKETAEAASRAKSVFLSNMSHELRTPLNAILGFAQIMERDDRIPEDQRKNIATINRSGQHLLSLINDVLEISRIEAGRTQATQEAFDLPAALTVVEEMTRIRAEAKGLAFALELPDDLPHHVMGDPHHLRQVLINLLGNAVKYTEKGQVRLTVATLPDRTIRFAVSDTGPGISEEDQGRLFQPFYQTEVGIAKGEGTGLGLAISQEFVRLMGGEITVASQPGQGSTFAFGIPLPATDAAPYLAGTAQVVGLAPGQPIPRILVAEDNPDNQQVVKQLLQQVGLQVRIAADGQQAVAGFQTWHPHLLLMDMRMPVMDGYAATRAIRSLPGGDKVPIVALTASAFVEDRGEVLAAGCNEIVKKPVEGKHLFEVIGRMLDLRFEYAQAIPALPTPAGTGAADLGALPPAVREELAQAASALDKKTTLAIVARLRTGHPAEAELIAHLADTYRYDLLLEHCSGK